MWRLRKKFSFSAMHKCENGRDFGTIHGHNFVCELFFEDEFMDVDGMCFDVSFIENICNRIKSYLEGMCILHKKNECFTFLGSKTLFVPFNPTVENLCKMIFDFVRRRLLERGHSKDLLESVRLYQDEEIYIEFYENVG